MKIELDPNQQLAMEVLKLLGIVKLVPWILLALTLGWFGFWLGFHTVEWMIHNLDYVIAFPAAMLAMMLAVALFRR